MITTYMCDDCGRRFFNLGWHAEACGSSNFRAVGGVEGACAKSGADRNGKTGKVVGLTAALKARPDGSGPEATQATKGKATS